MAKFRPMAVQGEPDYLFISTFQTKQPLVSNTFEMGFVSETKAPDTVYTLEAYHCPRQLSEITFLQNEPIIEKFNDNQMINGLNEVTLQNQTKVYKNYMAVTSLTIDTSKRKVDEKGFYSSGLNIYRINENKLKTCLVECYKRSITAISSYKGKLVCSQVSP